MELTRSFVKEHAREYAETEPLYTVEQEQIDLLPEMFADGDFGWRDAEWVVQWYFRRFLGAYPDAERRAAEEAFRDNDFEAVVKALTAVAESSDIADKLNRLTALDGVDVPVASAFLLFMLPSRYVPVGEREWTVLVEAGVLTESYSDEVTVDDYLMFGGACRELCDRFEVDAWTLYRALWNLSADRES